MMLKRERLTEREDADECDLCLLGLIFLSSLLTGSSEVNDAHVFISSGQNVRLSCNNAIHDCKSTTWIYNRFSHSAAVELIGLGIKKKDTERHERLSLGSDCSLNINNITEEDYGLYSCRQYVNKQKQGTDARVYLHVLHARDDPASPVILVHNTKSTTTTPITSTQARDDPASPVIPVHNTKSTTTTPITSTQDPAETEVRRTAGSLFRVIVIIVEFAAFAAPTVILLQIICARRAGRKNSQHQRK
ncbi:hypothetical protein G5714_004165 [Onychostoma macrolepis]|uniref:Ig-like domain-containing protein n=1 Tax=Onychostoma macrolepis TaxID=369639 RepID=A0A7J6DBG7_9TELE|nr:hypothetical protein G5714_004165 [Onychostoma macrolepis]